MRTIPEINTEIDEIDREMVTLFFKRIKLSEELGSLKKLVGLEADDPNRESDIVQKALGRVPPDYMMETLDFTSKLIELSKRVEIK